MISGRLNSLNLAHYLFKQQVLAGSTVLDATAGQGKDTLFLAQLVGPEGKVWAFDIQQEAICATRKLLEDNNLAERVKLCNTGHENLGAVVEAQLAGAMFNLGYLPAGNKAIVTRPETTIAALEQAIGKLIPGGLITLVLYTGHPGGGEEADALEAFVSTLPQAQFDVLKFTYPNRGAMPPYLLAIWKR